MLIVLGTLAFLLSFIGWRHLDPDGILFYQGIALCVIIAAAQTAFARMKHRTDWNTALKDGAITLLLSYTFLATVPTNVDRSFSVKMLQHLAQTPQGMSAEEIGRFYSIDFIDRGGLEKRLIEQQATGTMVNHEGRYVLTSKGQLISATAFLACDLFVCSRDRL